MTKKARPDVAFVSFIRYVSVVDRTDICLTPGDAMSEKVFHKAPRRSPETIEVTTVAGERVKVSRDDLEAILLRAYKESNSMKPLPKEMTTTQAADFLDVSRPFIVKLIKQRELPCRMVGKHRRIPSDALVKQREKMFHHAKSAADEMARASQALGLYEDAPSSSAP